MKKSDIIKCITKEEPTIVIVITDDEYDERISHGHIFSKLEPDDIAREVRNLMKQFLADQELPF